jgi:alpha-methylacyl-CoA racemase
MSLYSVFYAMAARGQHTEAIGTNFFDGGAPFYAIYETADGRYVSIAAIEARFWRNLLVALGIDPADMPDQHDRAQWPAMTDRLAVVFRTRSRDEWQADLGDQEVCFAPVMRLGEAAEHPHTVARGSFVAAPDGTRQVRPAPRLSSVAEAPGAVRPSFAYVGADTDAVLAEYGLDEAAVARLRAAGTIA